VNVRVLAATNRDLRQAAKDGGFREDLFYRLNVFPIQLPPLRDRRDDIPVLAWAFAQKFAQKMGRSLHPLSTDCVDRLKSYHWPGNVRELENVMERAVITARDGRLDLELALPESTHAAAFGSPVPADGPPTFRTAQEMEVLERGNLILALEATNWRVAGENGAAQRLGMNPSTLTSRMKALGIQRPK
jgi:transcriptional regulator with GAF, ATPase, and Fis domain